MANEYVTAAELKATLNLTGETFADADVAVAVEAASRGVDQVCNRRFWLDVDANQVRYYRPKSECLTRIDDLVTLTAVAADGNGAGTFPDTLTVNTDFVLTPYNADADGRPWNWLELHPNSSRRFPVEYPRSVRVTGRFGWAAVPPAVKQATTILASKLLRRAREAPFAVVALGIEGDAIRLASTDPDVRFLIGPYVRVPVA